MKDLKKAYTEILDVCQKYSDCDFAQLYEFRDIKDMTEKCRNHLMIIDWNEKYKLDIKHSKWLYNSTYVELWGNKYISYYGDAEADKNKWYWKYISREDNGKQPKNERLFQLSYPDGAYIFWSSYQPDVFKSFFEELKTYWYKYVDTVNSYIYFPLEVASKILEDYDSIYNKYRELYKVTVAENDIKRLEEELQKLKTKIVSYKIS